MNPATERLPKSLTSSWLFSAEGLSRHYGGRQALDGVSFRLAEGQVMAVLGPNGAGKSTLLRLLSGVERPNQGRIFLAGQELRKASAWSKRRVAFFPDRALSYPRLNAEENLRFFAQLQGSRLEAADLDTLIKAADLQEHSDRPIRTFSRGMLQRLELARLDLGDPDAALLDEPFAGLDMPSMQRLYEQIERWRSEGRALIFTTHEPDHALRLADSVMVLREGRIVWQGPAGRLEKEELSALLADAGLEPKTGAESGFGSDPIGQGEAAPSGESTNFWVGVEAILKKDLLSEWRGGEVVLPVITLSLLLMVILHFIVPEAGANALWVALVFGSTLGLARVTALEITEGRILGLRMAPIDPASFFIAKFLAAFFLAALICLSMLPVGMLWMSLPADRLLPILGTLLAGLVGWVAAGVLTSAMAAYSRAEEILIPLLLYPLALPMLLATAKALMIITDVGSTASVLTPLVLVLAFDVIFLTLGALLLPTVLE